MPLNKKGKKIMAAMKKEYGKRGEEIFYRSKNKGTISGVEGRRRSLSDRTPHRPRSTVA